MSEKHLDKSFEKHLDKSSDKHLDLKPTDCNDTFYHKEAWKFVLKKYNLEYVSDPVLWEEMKVLYTQKLNEMHQYNEKKRQDYLDMKQLKYKK